MKKIIIIGASSGIGKEIAERYASKNCLVGITGRRTALLEGIKKTHPNNIILKTMDICENSATEKLQELVAEMDGIDTLFINSGYGKFAETLDPAIELQTVETNVKGFTNVIVWGYNYFKTQNIAGHIVVTSSVASVRSLRQAPAYSATKRYMRHYVDCLAQRAHHEKLKIKFTTLMPGFIDTDFLKGAPYPLTISLSKASKLIFKAIEHKKRAVYLPCRWNFVVFFWQLIPKWIWERYC